MAPNLKSSSRFRVKKLSKATLLPVLREEQIDSSEYESLQVDRESGVEKAEEKEYHLQAALAGNLGGATEEIPAPPAEECKAIDYDKLYPLVFKKPASYIRFSQTVDECTGCQYDMTTEDDVYLKAFNQQKKSGPKCSETDFERIMELFEVTAAEQTPYASVDNTLASFETMQTALKQQPQHFSPKVQVLAKDIYEYWKARRQASGNTSLQPSLKFEKDPERDDGDPYVCFRRRDARTTRKTRNRDSQSTDKLRRLRKELEDGRELIRLALTRETTKKELLKVEKDIFESRIKIKDTKVKLGIKTDDDDLINQRPQKRKHSDFAQRPSGPQMRLPGRSDGRALDADLIQLSDLLAQKENLLQTEIEDQAEKHRKWNLNHVDLTRGPLSPVTGQETSFRPAQAQYSPYLMTPPSSVTSESFDHASPILEKPEPFGFPFRCSSPPEEEPRGQPAYRRRIGRGGRLWIDRKGMSAVAKGVDNGTSDRWKYDQDDEDEQPIYELDPFDTKALKFRATIPFPQHLHQRAVVARPSGNSPNNPRVIAAPQPQPPPQPTQPPAAS